MGRRISNPLEPFKRQYRTRFDFHPKYRNSIASEIVSSKAPFLSILHKKTKVKLIDFQTINLNK